MTPPRPEAEPSHSGSVGGHGLLECLRREISKSGPIPFSTFQRLALYHKDWGYYARGSAPGKQGADFLTAPEIDPAFGVLLGRQIRQMAELMGRPESFRVHEYGAGSGSLARSLLDAWSEEGCDLYRKSSYRIVEISPALREHQRRTLANHLDAVTWEPVVSGVQEPSPGVIVMNEVLDALPVDRFIGSEDGLREIRVGLRDGCLAFETCAASAEQQRLLSSFLPPGVNSLPMGHEMEACPQLSSFVSAASLTLSRGYLIAIDYGHTARELLHPSRRRGTLMTYEKHRASESLLDKPGLVDITSHVNWNALEKTAASAGFRHIGMTTQMKFLLALGLGDMIEGLEKQNLDPVAETRRRLDLTALIRPGGMGEMFQVFMAGKDAPWQLSGLQTPWA